MIKASYKHLFFVMAWILLINREICLGKNITKLNAMKGKNITKLNVIQGKNSTKLNVTKGKTSTKQPVTSKGEILQFWSRDPKFDTTKNPTDIRRSGHKKRHGFQAYLPKDMIKEHFPRRGTTKPEITFEEFQFTRGESYKPTKHKKVKIYNRAHTYPMTTTRKVMYTHAQSMYVYKNKYEDYEKARLNHSVHKEKDRYDRTHLIEPIIRHQKYRSNRNRHSAKAKDTKHKKKHGASKRVTKTYADGVPLRNDPGGQHKQKTDKDCKHTRMTPMVLMQHEGSRSDESKDNSPYKWYLKRFVLNAYSVADQFDKILGDFPSALVTKEVLGRTAEYNDILLLKITKAGDIFFRSNNDKYLKSDKKEKKIIFIVHALSVMGLNNVYSLTVENYLKKLMSYYLAHLDKFDIYLMPLANPDGYLQNRNLNYWNKNFSPQSECNGVALDRNFDVSWNFSAKTTSSCHPHYPGPRPFSEAESSAVRDVFHKYSHKIIAYLHVHPGTYDLNTFKGDAVLYPKGYSDVQADDDKYLDIRGDIDDAIKSADFRVISVTVDTIYNWYGKTSGCSVDYAATVYGIPYAMELVLQSYQDPFEVNFRRIITGLHEETEYYALTEIWSRIIDVIFTNIWNKLEAKED